MKNGILTRILSLVLTLSLLLPMVAMFPAAAEETLYDNSDLALYYSESKICLGRSEYIPEEEADLVAPEPETEAYILSRTRAG